MSRASGPSRTRTGIRPGGAGILVIALLLAFSLPGRPRAEQGAPVDAVPAGPESHHEVTRTPTGFSVRATNGSLPEILAQIGGEAGFDVLDTGKSYPIVNAAIEDTPLDSLLRQLLRGANFIILYKGGGRGQTIDGRGIERIVLLTSAGSGAPPGGAPPARAGRVSPLAGAKAGKPAQSATQPPPNAPQPDDGTAALAAAAAAAGDSGGSEILQRLRAARAARGGGADGGGGANPDPVGAMAAETLGQLAGGGQLDPSVLEAARLAAQRAIEASGGGGFGSQGFHNQNQGGFNNQGFGNQGLGNQGYDQAPMDDAMYPDE